MNRTFLIQKIKDNSVGVEIGVWRADFSKEIIKNKKIEKLYLIDPWLTDSTTNDRWYSKNIITQNGMDEIYKSVINYFDSYDNIVIIRSDSDAAMNTFEDNYFDWSYIDGNHSYEYVKKDLLNSYNKVKSGGFIYGDDFHDSDIRKALDEFVSEKNLTYYVESNQFIIHNEK